MKIDLSALNDAVLAAETFQRWARFHLDRARPDQVERYRKELIEALERLDVQASRTDG